MLALFLQRYRGAGGLLPLGGLGACGWRAVQNRFASMAEVPSPDGYFVQLSKNLKREGFKFLWPDDHPMHSCRRLVWWKDPP